MTETIRGKMAEEIYEGLEPKPLPSKELKQYLKDNLGYTETDASESVD